MTDEQKAAFVLAQVAMMNAEITGLNAENAWRISNGQSPTYGEAAFDAVIDRYKHTLGENAILKFFQS